MLRHSGSIARMEATGNPKAPQDHLRHQPARMTLRYMKTLSPRRSLEIHQTVDLGVTSPHRQRARRYPAVPAGRVPGRSY